MKLNSEKTMNWVMSCVEYRSDNNYGARISKVQTITKMRDTAPFTLSLDEALHAFQHVFGKDK